MMNFSRIDYARNRALPLRLMPALLLMLACLAWGSYRYWQVESGLAATRLNINTERQLLARKSAEPVETAPIESKERVKSVNDAIAALNTPWPALLGSIEAARPGTVALMQVEPRPKDNVVLVTAQADDMGTLIDFMRTLSHTPPFIKVVPVRQEQLLAGSTAQKQATFEARWEERP